MDIQPVLDHLRDTWEIDGPVTLGIRLAEGEWIEVGTLELGRMLSELTEE